MFVPTCAHKICAKISILWLACACGWDTTEKIKKLGVTDMNVLVISIYFIHPTARQGTQFLSTLISPFTKHLQGTFKIGSDGMQDTQKEKV